MIPIAVTTTHGATELCGATAYARTLADLHVGESSSTADHGGSFEIVMASSA